MRLCFTVLVLLAVIATAASASVVTHSYSVPAGWSLFALPGIPLTPDPPTVCGTIDIDGRLYRWDAATQSLILYDMWSPESFGNMLLTDGYWLNSSASGSISYSGLNDNDSMDVWISMPKRGWTLMGNPFSGNFEWPSAKVTDGNVTVSITDACRTYDWLFSTGYWWDNSTQSLIDIGLEDDWPTTTTMQAWHGYWLQSKVDKIALIFESTL
jgi:hypothetical protein